MKNHYIVLYSIDADINEQNIFSCESEKIYDNNNFYIVKKTIKNININIFITYSKISGFVRGHVYKDNKEYEILNYIVLSSIQLGNFAYDNVGLCKI